MNLVGRWTLRRLCFVFTAIVAFLFFFFFFFLHFDLIRIVWFSVKRPHTLIRTSAAGTRMPCRVGKKKGPRNSWASFKPQEPFFFLCFYAASSISSQQTCKLKKKEGSSEINTTKMKPATQPRQNKKIWRKCSYWRLAGTGVHCSGGGCASAL